MAYEITFLECVYLFDKEVTEVIGSIIEEGITYTVCKLIRTEFLDWKDAREYMKAQIVKDIEKQIEDEKQRYTIDDKIVNFKIRETNNNDHIEITGWIDKFGFKCSQTEIAYLFEGYEKNKVIRYTKMLLVEKLKLKQVIPIN